MATILPLVLEEVSYARRGTRLVKDVSFSLEDGRRTVLMGPNGAGKSLLLRLCHGLIRPSAGRVTWRGDDPPRHQAMVFQRPVMLRRSVEANLEYPLKLRKVAKKERRERAAEMLARVGLGRFAATPARVLSGGEQQLLSLARAWITGPQVLFLDEPTANLDPAATHAIESVVETIAAQGTKIVMTTHDLPQARRLAEDVLFLHRGRLVERAPAETFFAGPGHELARAFLAGELLWWKRKALTPGGGVERLLEDTSQGT